MIILGSNSSGRKMLMEQITRDFLVKPSLFDENTLKEKIHKPSSLVLKLSMGKLKDLIPKYINDTIICADTVVYQNGVIYEKPLDREDAFNMLKTLSSKPHYVYSGVALYHNHKIYNFYDKTKVIFHKLSNKEINDYLDTGEYIGKAGSYGIQSVDDKFIKKVVGDFDTVIGMSVKMIKEIIK
jgi:septum formation protein